MIKIKVTRLQFFTDGNPKVFGGVSHAIAESDQPTLIFAKRPEKGEVSEVEIAFSDSGDARAQYIVLFDEKKDKKVFQFILKGDQTKISYFSKEPFIEE